jgi:hypothetical protein
MGYWTNQQQSDGIQDRSNHPWATLLRKTLDQVQPDFVETLLANGDMEAYLSISVNNCMKEIRRIQKDGSDYQTAKELAFADFLPIDESDDDEPWEDWEEEGGQQDAIDAFSAWIDKPKAEEEE